MIQAPLFEGHCVHRWLHKTIWRAGCTAGLRVQDPPRPFAAPAPSPLPGLAHPRRSEEQGKTMPRVCLLKDLNRQVTGKETVVGFESMYEKLPCRSHSDNASEASVRLA